MSAFARAEAMARQNAWGAAAVLFAQAASQRMKAGDRDGAREAWEAAGESWRRDDRPKSAMQALEMASQLAADPRVAVLTRVKLAGTMSEVGDLAAVLRVLDGSTAEGPLAAMVLDEQINALLGLGRREEARSLVVRLADAAQGPLQVACWFRNAQLARLDGRLADAEEQLALVVADLEDQPQALAGVAAAEAELGEIAAMRGDYDAAMALYDDALAHFQKIGRKALVWRADAGRVRVAVDAGLTAWSRGLDEGIAHAVDREMASLEADLRLARGVACASSDRAAAADDLQRAIRLSTETGARHRRGRARLELARRVTGDPATLDEALADLDGNEPWRLRTALELGIRRKDQQALLGCMARATAIGMGPEVARARAALGK